MGRFVLFGATAATAVALLASPTPSAGARAGLTCAGETATISGTSGDDDLTGTRGRDVIVAANGNDNVKGRGGADLICSGSGDDVVIGGGGDDKVYGGLGGDIIIGGAGDDRLAGEAGIDGLLGAGGNDSYAGGPDLDFAAFLTAKQGVRADLMTGTASGEGSDTLGGIEALVGSDHADQLLGDEHLNALFSGLGADVLNGRGGNDFILLGDAPGPVEIDLGDDLYTGGGLAKNIENVIGSPFDDTIYGDSQYNYLDGADGNDAVDGIDGSDDCVAETAFNCRTYPTAEAEPAPPTTSPESQLLRIPDAPRTLTRPAPPSMTADGPPARRVDQGTQYGYTNCPIMSNVALIGTRLNGYGFFASRSSQGFGGYFPWNYSVNLYFSGSSYWWQNANGTWSGPYDRSVNHQWVQDVGTSLTAYGWFYSWGDQQWYSLGSCNGQGLSIGF